MGATAERSVHAPTVEFWDQRDLETALVRKYLAGIEDPEIFSFWEGQIYSICHESGWHPEECDARIKSLIQDTDRIAKISNELRTVQNGSPNQGPILGNATSASQTELLQNPLTRKPIRRDGLGGGDPKTAENLAARLGMTVEDVSAQLNTTEGLHLDDPVQFEVLVELMKQLGIKAYRFSIFWRKVEIDQAEIDRYQWMAELCIQNGIEPIVFINHFDLPSTETNWHDEQFLEEYMKLAKLVVPKLVDAGVRILAPFNEPMVNIGARYLLNGRLGIVFSGLWPPYANHDLPKAAKAWRTHKKVAHQFYLLIRKLGIETGKDLVVLNALNMSYTEAGENDPLSNIIKKIVDTIDKDLQVELFNHSDLVLADIFGIQYYNYYQIRLKEQFHALVAHALNKRLPWVLNNLHLVLGGRCPEHREYWRIMIENILLNRGIEGSNELRNRHEGIAGPQHAPKVAAELRKILKNLGVENPRLAFTELGMDAGQEQENKLERLKFVVEALTSIIDDDKVNEDILFVLLWTLVQNFEIPGAYGFAYDADYGILARLALDGSDETDNEGNPYPTVLIFDMLLEFISSIRELNLTISEFDYEQFACAISAIYTKDSRFQTDEKMRTRLTKQLEEIEKAKRQLTVVES